MLPRSELTPRPRGRSILCSASTRIVLAAASLAEVEFNRSTAAGSKPAAGAAAGSLCFGAHAHPASQTMPKPAVITRAKLRRSVLFMVVVVTVPGDAWHFAAGR